MKIYLLELYIVKCQYKILALINADVKKVATIFMKTISKVHISDIICAFGKNVFKCILNMLLCLFLMLILAIYCIQNLQYIESQCL